MRLGAFVPTGQPLLVSLKGKPAIFRQLWEARVWNHRLGYRRGSTFRHVVSSAQFSSRVAFESVGRSFFTLSCEALRWRLFSTMASSSSAWIFVVLAILATPSLLTFPSMAIPTLLCDERPRQQLFPHDHVPRFREGEDVRQGQEDPRRGDCQAPRGPQGGSIDQGIVRNPVILRQQNRVDLLQDAGLHSSLPPHRQKRILLDHGSAWKRKGYEASQFKGLSKEDIEKEHAICDPWNWYFRHQDMDFRLSTGGRISLKEPLKNRNSTNKECDRRYQYEQNDPIAEQDNILEKNQPRPELVFTTGWGREFIRTQAYSLHALHAGRNKADGNYHFIFDYKDLTQLEEFFNMKLRQKDVKYDLCYLRPIRYDLGELPHGFVLPEVEGMKLWDPSIKITTAASTTTSSTTPMPDTTSTLLGYNQSHVSNYATTTPTSQTTLLEIHDEDEDDNEDPDEDGDDDDDDDFDEPVECEAGADGEDEDCEASDDDE
ncbi:hypothetical protein L596_010176 [Steinernema carpocapsae]|uniref:Uncharacterized protein n=1 Tax=Steinernema carpocapsae TaxID=34508 RepID=A0A4U5PI17_STECR|nr:hypothetical protein L596_010176 [Steinernema carpocapsae]